MRIFNDYSQYHVILWNRHGMRRHYDMGYFSFEFLNEDFEFILVLKFDFPNEVLNPNIKDLTNALEKIYLQEASTFVILTPRQELPLYKERPGEIIYSFSCILKSFKQLFNRYNNISFVTKNLLYEILDHILVDYPIFKRILARQIPIEEIKVLQTFNCNVIIPHRGSNIYLKNLLYYLDQINNINVHIGIDQLMPRELAEMAKHHPNQNFWSFEPNPLGPYVIRNWLIDNTDNDIIFFQDSDDISCSDRFLILADFMIRNRCQLCGSHEIVLDCFNKVVRAVRFPADVMSALEFGPGHCLLHPTSAILRSWFYSCGKLSEERRFGNDTKFLYRCFFTMNTIKNIDEFLYIRRIRPSSLTTSPETMIGSPARLMIMEQWVTDFALIKAGKLKLEDSSLVFVPSKYRFRVANVASG